MNLYRAPGSIHVRAQRCLARLSKGFLVSFPIMFLIACSSAPESSAPVNRVEESTAEAADELLVEATGLGSEEAALLIIQAAELLTVNDEYARVLEETESLMETELDDSLRLELVMLRADAALQLGRSEQALDIIESVIFPTPAEAPLAYYHLLSAIHSAVGNHEQAINALARASAMAQDEDLQQISDAIWRELNRLDDTRLNAFASEADSYRLRGWIELANVYRADQFSIRSQLNAINQWRRTWNRHMAIDYLPSDLQELNDIWSRRPRQIALILPLRQPAGLAIQEGFLSAYYAALEISNEVPGLSVYDSTGINGIGDLYDRAVAEGAELVIGPLDKRLVNELHQRRRLPVPTLALNYADSPNPGPANLYQFGLAPEDEIRQIVRLARAAGHRNAAILTPDGEDYRQLQETFASYWQQDGGNLVSRASFTGDADYAEVIKRIMAIDSSEARAERLLDILPRSDMRFTPRRRGDIDFLFLIANPRQGRQIKPTLAFYFAEDLPVFAMPSINDGLNNQSENQDLDGIVFIDAPWVLDESALKSNVENTLRPVLGSLQRLRAMGVDAFMLHARLEQLASQQVYLLRGTTGTLSMTENGRVSRQLELARFTNGLVRKAGLMAGGED